MTKMKSFVIGVDIGGTRTKCGLVDTLTGDVIESIVQPTEKEDSGVFMQQIKLAVDQFSKTAAIKNGGLKGIGIGIPGFTSGDGVVTTTYGFLAFMEDYPLKDLIEKKFGLACCIDNDARIVALGEALYGGGKNYERALTLTLGTGVGFGLVINGAFTAPMPLEHMGGHIKINNEGEPCYCGKTGCLEALVSSTGILNIAKNTDGLAANLSAEQIFKAAEKGNKDAMAVVQKTCGYLHDGIHNYVNLFAPDVIILGGGIAQGLSPYLNIIKGRSYLSPFPEYTFKLVVSTLKETAGMLGSAALVTTKNNFLKPVLL